MAIIYSLHDTRYTLAQKRAVTKWVKEAISEEGKQLGDVSIVLCSDSYILKINQEYLQHDYFTDIITFDYSTDDLLAGELFISIDTVKGNAKEYGVTIREELLRVIIHGVLHLCGYKDKTVDEIKLMREKEDYYLKSV